ncbi:MAG: DivIVA domain-containing protein [Actinomycetota bacterium]|nr:DivIVA domain-containing protein [Actinomycetota bacterium]
MDLLFVLLALAVLGVAAVVSAGRGGGLAEAPSDLPPTGALPQGPLRADALEQVRFPVAFRGYRMDHVDELLDRVAGELAARDARIAELEAGRAGQSHGLPAGRHGLSREPAAHGDVAEVHGGISGVLDEQRTSSGATAVRPDTAPTPDADPRRDGEQ